MLVIKVIFTVLIFIETTPKSRKIVFSIGFKIRLRLSSHPARRDIRIMSRRELAASVIILTSNPTADHTRLTLECLRKHTVQPYELFLYQDDKTAFGFSKDNNKFIRLAQGRYIILMNDDLYTSEGWLEEMMELAESDESIGMVGAKLTSPTSWIHYGGKLARGKYLELQNIREYNPEVDFVIFALVLIKREVIRKIGLLDESYKMGFEDLDYCLQVRRAGYKIAVADIPVIHADGTSSRKPAAQLKIVRGAVIFYRRLGWPIRKILIRGFVYYLWNQLRYFSSSHPKVDNNTIASRAIDILYRYVYRLGQFSQ